MPTLIPDTHKMSEWVHSAFETAMAGYKLAAATEANNEAHKLELAVEKILGRRLESHRQELNEVRAEVLQLREGLHARMEKMSKGIQDLRDDIQELTDIFKESNIQERGNEYLHSIASQMNAALGDFYQSIDSILSEVNRRVKQSGIQLPNPLPPPSPMISPTFSHFRRSPTPQSSPAPKSPARIPSRGRSMSPSTFFGPINYTPQSPTHHRVVTGGDGETAGDSHTAGDETTPGDVTTPGDTATAPGQERVGDTGDGELTSNTPSAGDPQRSGDGPAIGSDQHAGDGQQMDDCPTSGDGPASGDDPTSGQHDE
ncbi:hypothetical protein NLI96_g12935 [Meripilus lineatus]|uniref:Uncharacterized protein n=1 Tax=Meripilus lineatus TaxID=2056292 RepID=A0AAD5UP79_9APHY|nr:hypothetical protein NLI96_g12935 [Physisporinus lineatus]